MDDYEYARTCNRCGQVRYMPRSVVETRPRKQAKAVGWATPIFGKKRQQIRAEQAIVDMQTTQQATADQCRACGSTSYTEERVALS